MICLVSILNHLKTLHKMMLILTLGPILLMLVGDGKLHPDDHNKAHWRCKTGLKLLKGRDQNAATNLGKTDIWPTTAASDDPNGRWRFLQKCAGFEKGCKACGALLSSGHRTALTQPLYNLAMMTANEKGVKPYLEKAFTPTSIAKQNTSRNPNARLRLNQFLIAIEKLLDTIQFNRTELQRTKLHGTHP